MKENKTDSLQLEESIEQAQPILEKIKEKPRRRKKWIILLVIIVLFLIIRIAVSSMKTATIEYNIAVADYNKKIVEYQSVSEFAEVSNIEGMVGDFGTLDEMSTGIFSLLSSKLGGNNADKIANDIETIHELIETVDKEIDIVKQITNPSEAWVVECLKTVNSITQMQGVTADHDPNGLLNKPNGGYTSCIYFNINGIDLAEIPGKDIVDKGTDVGGCIEVYENLQDAESRCEYLAGFDNTILYSGSFAVLGTMVIRTSYILTNEQQVDLTNKIVNVMTILK